MQQEIDRERQASKKNAMNRSQHIEENTEMNILKRRNDSQKKEIELLKRKNDELKTQLEAYKSSHSERSSFHQDQPKSTSETRSVTIKRDHNAQRELQLKDLEVIKNNRDKRTEAGKSSPAARNRSSQGSLLAFKVNT